MLRPLISVVVIAYNRKEYILEAVKSALNQTLEKDLYEVMVIKNFADPTIDKFLDKNGIININSDNYSLSGKIVESSILASGEYICFLEDDDLWSSGRLIAFKYLLKNYHDLDFYHNNFFYFRFGSVKFSQSLKKGEKKYLTEVKAKDAKLSLIFESSSILDSSSSIFLWMILLPMRSEREVKCLTYSFCPVPISIPDLFPL